MTSLDTRPRRSQRPQIVLEVRERLQLTPRMVRIIAGGAGMADVEENGFTDAYAKMIFPHSETDLTPPYDFAELRQRLPLRLMPSTRTYTVRRIDLAGGELWIDFVIHGEGIAAPWAEAAEPGDRAVLGGIGGGYAPCAEADWYLLAGDESALPAIASALEGMPSRARGVALIEVDDEASQLELDVPEGIRLQWLHRNGAEAGTTTVLIDAVRELDWPAGQVHVFAHGERGAMKSLRPYFTDERRLDRSQLSLSAYWAHGRQEDAFQAEKRDPIGRI